MEVGRSSESTEMCIAHNLQNETRLRGCGQHLPDGALVHLQTQLLDAPKLLQPERLSDAKHTNDGHSLETAVSCSSTQ